MIYRFVLLRKHNKACDIVFVCYNKYLAAWHSFLYKPCHSFGIVVSKILTAKLSQSRYFLCFLSIGDAWQGKWNIIKVKPEQKCCRFHTFRIRSGKPWFLVTQKKIAYPVCHYYSKLFRAYQRLCTVFYQHFNNLLYIRDGYFKRAITNIPQRAFVHFPYKFIAEAFSFIRKHSEYINKRSIRRPYGFFRHSDYLASIIYEQWFYKRTVYIILWFKIVIEQTDLSACLIHYFPYWSALESVWYKTVCRRTEYFAFFSVILYSLFLQVNTSRQILPI